MSAFIETTMAGEPRHLWTFRPATDSGARRGRRSRMALLAFAALVILISVRPVLPSERPAAGAAPDPVQEPRPRMAPPRATHLPLQNDLGPDWN